MSETKHTPGPWQAIEWSSHAPTTVVSDFRVQRVVVAECSGQGRHTHESIADARLIAASPELLALLVKLSTHLAYGDPLLDEIEAAIRKAKGE